MKITSVMSRDVVSVGMDDAIGKVKIIFEEHGFHHLLVVQDARLVGVISDRDLLKSISPNVDSIAATAKDMATLEKKVHQIMTRKPIAVSEHALVKDAIELFNNERISCLPVINEKSHPVGIVSWRDIIRVIAEKLDKN